MKKVTLGLLAFLTFLPSLVCFMAVCPMKSAQAGETVSCHDKKSEDGKSNVESFMLVQDCLGVDFFQQDVNQDFSPDLTFTDIDFTWADLTITHNIEPNDIHAIRGPPPLFRVAMNGQPLYLSTQRIRI